MAHRWDPVAPPVSDLVRPVRIDPSGGGGPTRKQARGPRWRITSRGLAVPAGVDDELVEQRILEAVARAGDRAVVTGWAALRLHGGNFFDGLERDGRTRRPVPIAANGERLTSGHGALVVADRIPPDEVVAILGIRCTRPERALYDEMQRIGEVREMAVAVGAACAARLTSVKRMRLHAATRRWYRDVRTVKEAVEMAVEDCRSPQEDRFRLLWEYDAGWGRPLINRTILDERGRFVATPDLLDPVRGVVGGVRRRRPPRRRATRGGRGPRGRRTRRGVGVRRGGRSHPAPARPGHRPDEGGGGSGRPPGTALAAGAAGGSVARRGPGPSRHVKRPLGLAPGGRFTSLDDEPQRGPCVESHSTGPASSPRVSRSRIAARALPL